MRFLRIVLSAVLAIVVAGASSARAGGSVSYNLATEPETLDPTQATGIPEATVITNCFDGLARTDPSGNEIVPRVAERWDLSPDGRTYTFHLRESYWSDGRPVTAGDFEFAMKRLLDPAQAAEYAVMLFYLEGAEDYNSGKLKDPSRVGVRALDDRTLQIRLRAPTPFFLKLLPHQTYMPQPRHVVAKDPNWALNPQTYICNGAFTVAEWRHHDRLILKKNPRHWNAANVVLDELVLRTIESVSTELAMFETGEMDVTYQVPTESIARCRTTAEFRSFPQIATYFICFNTKRKPLDDARVRRAMGLAIDRRVIADKLCLGGEKPAYALVSPSIRDADGRRDFRDVGGDLFNSPDVETARRLLAEAGYPGGKGFPRVTYIYNDDERHRKIALVLQNMWKKNLGILVELRVEEWKVLLTHRRWGGYDICRHGWVGDYADPSTFLDMFITGSGLNDCKWSNADYDRLIADAREELDPVKRMTLLHRAESVLMDAMPISPLFFYVTLYMQKSNVSGVVRNALGYAYFDRARVERK
jgi:oligopeptide transport system substrate-binding protein